MISCFSLGTGPAPVRASADSLSPLPLPAAAMTQVRDFVAGLARAGKSASEIKKLVDDAYRDKALGLTSIYYILKRVKAGKSTEDQRKFSAKKTKRTAAIIAAVATDVADDRRVSVKDLASVHGVSVGTMFNILRDDLGLVKKSARWVPKLLSEEQKLERVWTCRDFIAAVQRRSMSMLDDVVTMNKTMVCYHTPETKKQSKQWIKNGKPGPIKARVQASCIKQMVMAFFDSRGLIYTHIVPRGAKINAMYIVKALGTFMKHFKKKRPEGVPGVVFPLG